MKVNWLNQKLVFIKYFNIFAKNQEANKKIIIINISIVKQWNKQLNEWNEILEQEEIIQIEDININDQMGFMRCFYK